MLAAVVTGLAGVSALSAARSMEAAESRLVAVRDGAEGPSVTEVLPALRRAQHDLDLARDAVDRVPVRLVAAVPVLGRSLDAERAVAHTAGAVVDAAVVGAELLPEFLSAPGVIDLEVVQRLRTDLVEPARSAQDGWSGLDSGSTALTPPVVGAGVTRAKSTLGPAVELLAQAEAGLDVLHGLLGGSGDRTLMIALENNAELRGTGGYVATFAMGALREGRLDLGEFQGVEEVNDTIDQVRTVDAPVEFRRDYGPHAADTTLFRSWNMSPDAPQSAEVGARVAGVLLGNKPDVVLMLDVRAMSAIAQLSGESVRLGDGTVIAPDQLLDALLVESYADAGTDIEAQLRRRDELQAAASAPVQGLLQGSVPFDRMAPLLVELAGQRHVKLWSARPTEQALLEELDLAGHIEVARGEDLSLVSVNNIGANKLDQYVQRDLAVDVVVNRDMAHVRQRVRFENQAPAGLVPYVAGFVLPGTVTSRVELSLPPGAVLEGATLDGGPLVGDVREGATRTRVVTRLELAREEAAEFEVAYRLPLESGRYRLRVVPQPLVRDAGLSLTVRPAEGVELSGIAGTALVDGELRGVGELSTVQTIGVDVRQPSLWDRARAAFDR